MPFVYCVEVDSAKKGNIYEANCFDNTRKAIFVHSEEFWIAPVDQVGL